MSGPMLSRVLVALALITFAASLQLVLSDVDAAWVTAAIWGAAIGCLGCAVLLRWPTPLAWALALGGGLLAAIAVFAADGSVPWQDGPLGWASEATALLATALLLAAALIALQRPPSRRPPHASG